MLNQIINDYKNGFNQCNQLSILNNSGGARRGKKGNITENFMKSIIKLQFPNLLERERKININGNFNYTCDFYIKNQDKQYVFEFKDYADANMIQSFIGKSLALINKFDDAKCILISAQNACDLKTFNDMINSYNLSDISKNRIIYYSVFSDVIRNSKNPNWLIDYNNIERNLINFQKFLEEKIK